MEQSIEVCYTSLCSTCLSSDRHLISVNSSPTLLEIFRLLMYDFQTERYGIDAVELEQLVCWECAALMKKLDRFKKQVHTAQHHCKLLASAAASESLETTFFPQPLSSLDMVKNISYDKVFFCYSGEESDDWSAEDKMVAGVNLVEAESMILGDTLLAEAYSSSEALGGGGISMPVIVSTESMLLGGAMPILTVSCKAESKMSPAMVLQPKLERDDKTETSSYSSIFLTEQELQLSREKAKWLEPYVNAIYKCELCIIGFRSQQEVEDHFVALHRDKPDHELCRVCFVYIHKSKLTPHVESHYLVYLCSTCHKRCDDARLMTQHLLTHLPKKKRLLLSKGQREKLLTRKERKPIKPSERRKLLSKQVIEGYQCLECDHFFKTSRARKSHVARIHREGLECDHCHKKFVNRTTLTTHLKLHEGPQPRQECPICHKMVRVIQLKYHIQRHQNKGNYQCVECNKVFSQIATYQAHFKYSRAHASDEIFKFPCPMCNKGYPTKEQMQDHFNYQHLNKTAHKCPICNKPIATKANVDKHILRVHRTKTEKPRNHQCNACGKGFTDKKALVQHSAIHSLERPISCDVCGQTFKQKASLYTHRKRVHKVAPAKKNIEFMDKKEPSVNTISSALNSSVNVDLQVGSQ